MKVALRKRKLRTGKTSLYLDFYKEGKREYEYLDLFLVPAKTPADRKQNKENLAMAEAVRGQRQLEIQKGIYGFKTSRKNDNHDFIAFYETLLEARENTKSNHDNWFGALKYIKLYSKGAIKFKDLTPEFVEGFRHYLLNAKMPHRGVKLAQNSCVSYFNKFRAAINKAFEMRLIDENPVKRVKSIKQADSNRQYLTVEELQKLKKTACRSEVLKQAFMFSCLTGLRWSDVHNLKWNDIEHSKKMGTRIIFRQKKTDGQEYLPINEQALAYLPEKEDSNERVFVGLKYSAENNIKLAQWVLKAGITKTITFHCARHTNAVLLLSNGVGIETVSKMLGHRDLKTTQIYAKVVDELKQKAVNSIPQI